MSEQVEALKRIEMLLWQQVQQDTDWITQMRVWHEESEQQRKQEQQSIADYWERQEQRDLAIKQLREQEHEVFLLQHQEEAKRTRTLLRRQELWRKQDLARIERQEQLATRIYEQELQKLAVTAQQQKETSQS